MREHPCEVYTTRQLEKSFGLLDGQLQKALDLLEEKRFLFKIVYPGGTVYRHIPRYLTNHQQRGVH